MRTEAFRLRALSLLMLGTALHAAAQDATAQPPQSSSGAPLFAVDHSLLYAMLGLAVLQAIFIASLSGILRTLGGPGAWVKHLTGKGGRALALLPLLLFAGQAHAQAYKGEGGQWSDHQLFWVLIAVNVLLFAILLGQLSVLRGLTRTLAGTSEATASAPLGPSWAERLLRKLTRQVAVEKEQDILLDHNYDGIRELDNVLPPWWLWLFYGTVIWGVVYLVNVHVTNIWPQQQEEYTTEMQHAQADVAAYLAAQKAQVDERTAVQLTDAPSLAHGASIFQQNCATCHGQYAQGVAGPNLTDAYWLHGGGIHNVFHTITFGVQDKGMRSWKDDLKPAEIQEVASYILSLQGTHPAEAKEPQGDLWKDAADSTAAPVDTAQVAADTLHVAQQ